MTSYIDILYLEDDEDHLTVKDPHLRPQQSSFPIFGVLYQGMGPIIVVVVLFVGGLLYVGFRIAETILPSSSRSAPS